MPTISDLRLSRLLGLPVILGGKTVGRVERAVVSPDGRRLRGLILRQGLGGARWAGLEDIAVLGEVSVILQHPPVRLPPDAGFALRSVQDSGGLTLGWVTDVLLNPATCRVSALEVSLGLMEELMGRRFLVRCWTVTPRTGQVMIPCGPMLETRPQRALEGGEAP